VLNGSTPHFEAEVVQADAAIACKTNAFGPAVEFIGNRRQLIQGEGGLGEETSLQCFPIQDTVGHVDFDQSAPCRVWRAGLRAPPGHRSAEILLEVDFWRKPSSGYPRSGDGEGDDEQARVGDDASSTALRLIKIRHRLRLGCQDRAGGEAYRGARLTDTVCGESTVKTAVLQQLVCDE